MISKEEVDYNVRYFNGKEFRGHNNHQKQKIVRVSELMCIGWELA